MTEPETMTPDELKRLWRSLSPDGKLAVSQLVQRLLREEKELSAIGEITGFDFVAATEGRSA